MANGEPADRDPGGAEQRARGLATGERDDGPRGQTRGEDEDGLPGFDQLIGTFMHEPSLWPVLAVALGSGGAFAATLMILAGVDRNPFAAAALLLVLGMTIDVAVRARRRPTYRNGARLLALVWLAGGVFSALALWSGIAYTR